MTQRKIFLQNNSAPNTTVDQYLPLTHTPNPFVCVCVCVRSDLFAEWLSVSRTNKPLGSCSPAHLLSALQPLLRVGDLIAQAEV